MRCEVVPVFVIRKGVLPGCAGVSITAREAYTDRVFQGSPGDYFETKEEAWAAARSSLAAYIEENKLHIARQRAILDAQRACLAKLMGEKPYA